MSVCVCVCDAHIPVLSIMDRACHKNVYFYDVSICCGICVIRRAKRAPTLGCSIELSRDIHIYVYMYVSMSVCQRETHTKILMPKMRGQNYVAQMRMLKVSFSVVKTDL